MANGTQTYVLEGKKYTVPAGTTMDDLESFIKQSSAPEAPPKKTSAWENIKSGFTAPVKVKQEASEADVANAPRFTIPGSSNIPLAEGVSEAATLANFGVRPTMGMPEANLPALAVDVGSVASKLKEGTAVLARGPDGKIRPIVRGLSRLGGGVAGHYAGGTEGAVAGALAGPAIMEGLAPKRALSPIIQQEQLGTFMNKGYKPVEIPVAEQLAQKPSSIIQPGNDPAQRMVGSEGRAATWTNERVMELAKQGNHEAIQQAVRRGMKLPENARYVAGDPSYSSGVYNPRDVTKFTPEGTPIRQGGKKLSVIQEPTAQPVANKFAVPSQSERVAKIVSAASDNPDFKFEEVRSEIGRIQGILRQGAVPTDQLPVLMSQLKNYQQQMAALEGGK